MPAETMIRCEALTKRFGHFTAVDHVPFSLAKDSIFGFLGPNGLGKSTVIRGLPANERLNEPPEPSPGLSRAMPWANVIRSIPRPEGAREPLGKSHHAVSYIGCLDERFSHPFGADDLIAPQSQRIAPTREALGCILMAFRAIMSSDFHTTF